MSGLLTLERLHFIDSCFCFVKESRLSLGQSHRLTIGSNIGHETLPLSVQTHVLDTHMNISSTRKLPVKSTVTANSQEQAQQPETQFRPLTERWEVNGESYESTAELLAGAHTLENAEVTYHYTTEEQAAPFTKSERIKNTIGTGLMGAAAGSVVGAIGGTGLAFMAGVADIVGGFMGGRMQGVSRAVLWVPTLAGAAIGAAIGGSQGYEVDAPEVAGGSVSGLLTNNESGSVFYPNGKVDQKVDLNSFKDAPVPELTAEQRPGSKPVWNAVKGAAAGAAFIPAQFIPLVGLFSGPVVGSMIGDTFDDRTALGAGLGLAAGTGVGVATWYGISQAVGQMHGANYLPLAAVATGLIAGGAALGNKYFTETNTVPAHRDFGEQWWNQKSEEANQAH